MLCPHCQYMMGAFDKECPRCHGKSLPKNPVQTVAPATSPTPQTVPLPTSAGLTKCPYCAEDIQPNAQKCKHCGEWLVSQGQSASSPAAPVPHSSVNQQSAALRGQSYLNQSSTANEVTIYQAKLHWIVFAGPAVVSLFLFSAGMGMSGGLFGTGRFLLNLTALIILAGAVMRYLTAEFAVTNKRLLSKDGFISRRSNELMLSKIEGISVQQGLLGRALNYGTLVVSGTGGSKELFPNVAEPLELRKHIQMQLPS